MYVETDAGFLTVRDSRRDDVHKCYFLAYSVLLLSLPVFTQDLPAGTVLEARLSGATGAQSSAILLMS